MVDEHLLLELVEPIACILKVEDGLVLVSDGGGRLFLTSAAITVFTSEYTHYFPRAIEKEVWGKVYEVKRSVTSCMAECLGLPTATQLYPKPKSQAVQRIRLFC